jgi:uncharacterized protein YrrD
MNEHFPAAERRDLTTTYSATLTGDGVVNAAGEDLGKIEAIMLDVTSGRIAYAVLSFGGFLGMGPANLTNAGSCRLPHNASDGPA